MPADRVVQSLGATCQPGQDPSPTAYMESLLKEMQQFEQMAIASSTCRVYSTAHHQFLVFCAAVHSTAYPVREDTLQLFITSLSHCLSPQSLPTYLSGIRFYNIQQGFGDPFPGMLHLKLLIKGIKRSKGLSIKPPHLPVTVTTLKFLHKAILSSTLPPCDKSMLWSTCCLAFYGFLHASEFTSPTKNSISPHQTLLLSDITFGQDNSPFVRIKMSKVDPFRQVHVLSIAPAGSYVCAVPSTRHYLSFRTSTSGPLYVFRIETYHTRNILNVLLEEWLALMGVNTTHYSSHSFRIGAASTTAAVGIPS